MILLSAVKHGFKAAKPSELTVTVGDKVYVMDIAAYVKVILIV